MGALEILAESEDFMLLNEAIGGFVIAKLADGYSKTTIKMYECRLNVLSDWLRNPEIENITTRNLRDFLYYLRTDFKPYRPGGDDSHLTEATIHGYWKAIRAFWKWAAEDLDTENVALLIKAPRYKLKPITPLSKSEVILLLHAVESDRKGRKRSTRLRDRAIILFFLDTGLRLGELLRLQVKEVDLHTGKVIVRPHQRGRKTSGRIVYIGNKTRKDLWKYLSFRDTTSDDEPIFDITPGALKHMLRRLGNKSGIKCHAHKIRHTFAINFLRNGGNVFELQRLLGHSSLDMVRHYLNIAESDIENAHRKASPVDRWNI